MERIVIFTDEPGWHGKQLLTAFEQNGIKTCFVSLSECTFTIDNYKPLLQIPGFESELPQAAFVRGIPGGSLEEVVLYLDVLHALKILKIPVYNDGHAIERSVDKAMTSFMLHHAGLPTPATWVLRNRDDALRIAEHELKAGNMLITKPLFGSQGEGIRRIEKMTDLPWITPSHGVYYLQRFIHCAGSAYADIRVLVINGKAIAAMRRLGKFWLNNVAQGASCECIDLSPELAELAVNATKTLKMDYAGIDIICDRNGKHSLIEVNSIPAWKGLESVCNFSIAKLLTDDLINRYLKPDHA
jgi:RimK family alpha-L-glutamate ligase